MEEKPRPQGWEAGSKSVRISGLAWIKLKAMAKADQTTVTRMVEKLADKEHDLRHAEEKE